MTVGKASALVAGFVGAVAIGVAIAPTVHDRWSNTTDDKKAVTESAPARTDAPAPRRTTSPVDKRSSTSATRTAEMRAEKTPPNAVSSVAVEMWEPEFRDRVRKVMNPGTKLELAAENFESAEQFVTVAHAARNTGVPFVVLKDRVLNQDQSLAEAIHEFKPELDAKAEVARAQEAARTDLAN